MKTFRVPFLFVVFFLAIGAQVSRIDSVILTKQHMPLTPADKLEPNPAELSAVTTHFHQTRPKFNSDFSHGAQPQNTYVFIATFRFLCISLRAFVTKQLLLRRGRKIWPPTNHISKRVKCIVNNEIKIIHSVTMGWRQPCWITPPVWLTVRASLWDLMSCNLVYSCVVNKDPLRWVKLELPPYLCNAV